MAKLTSCSRCGHPVSTDALKCPHCGKYPHRVEPGRGSFPCPHCGGTVEASEAVNLMHPVCHEVCERLRATRGTFPCPVCQALLSYRDFKFTWVPALELPYLQTGVSHPCPKCGHPLKVEKCQHCGQPLFQGTGVTVPRHNQLPLYVHESCVPDVSNRRMPGPQRRGCALLPGLLVPLLLLGRGWHAPG